jgi:hypothetical protein
MAPSTCQSLRWEDVDFPDHPGTSGAEHSGEEGEKEQRTGTNGTDSSKDTGKESARVTSAAQKQGFNFEMATIAIIIVVFSLM